MEGAKFWAKDTWLVNCTAEHGAGIFASLRHPETESGAADAAASGGRVMRKTPAATSARAAAPSCRRGGRAPRGRGTRHC